MRIADPHILGRMFPVSDVIPSRTTPYVTISLIALNAIAFLIELQLSDSGLHQLVASYGVVPARFTWPDMLTSMFLHSGWLHFLGNMLYLWIFGDNVEDRLGHARYLLFYLFCGAAASLGQVASHPESTLPMIGASGAIAGVMGAYFVLYPQSRVLTAVFIIIFIDLIEIPAIYFLGIWFLMQLFSGVGSLGARAADGGIAFWAHVGGFAAGALLGALWRASEAKRRHGWEHSS
jgi:rhomboid family protein